MQQERSQCILNYPLRPENPANILYSYKSDQTDDELNDKIISSKSCFKFEDQCLTKEEKRKQKFNELAQAQNPRLKSYLEIIDPIDMDFNYSKIQKLSHEFMYEYIEQQIKKFQNTQEVLKVFSKKNDHINFFLCDFDGVIENTEVDVAKEQNRKSQNTQPNSAKDYSDQNEQNPPQKVFVMAQVNTYSQGKAFFYVDKSYPYEFVRAYPDEIYIEIKNKDDQIGVFKKKDFSDPYIVNTEQTYGMKLQTTNSSNLNTHNDSKIKDTVLTTDQDDDLSIRSKKLSISTYGNNTLNIRKKSYSTKKNILNSSVNTTPLRQSQNSSYNKYSAQQSTAATRRY